MQVPVVQQQFWILSDLLAEREMQIYLDCPWSSIPRNLLDKKQAQYYRRLQFKTHCCTSKARTMREF